MDLKDINVQDLLMEDLNRQIQGAIDDEVSYSFMMMYWKEQGWTTVKLSRFQDNNHAVDITDWLFDQDLRDGHDYYRNGAEFVFASEKIATMFALRWVE
jgi:hypothetical protein